MRGTDRERQRESKSARVTAVALEDSQPAVGIPGDRRDDQRAGAQLAFCALHRYSPAKHGRDRHQQRLGAHDKSTCNHTGRCHSQCSRGRSSVCYAKDGRDTRCVFGGVLCVGVSWVVLASLSQKAEGADVFRCVYRRCTRCKLTANPALGCSSPAS